MILTCLLTISVPQNCFAAGKTAEAYKNTTYTGTSDAKAFLNGIYSYDSNYTTTFKEGSNVSNSNFYSKAKTIKYWSSHGTNSGTLYGNGNNTTNINIFNDYSNFSWAGSNLEFVFLAACRQLDGSGSNPRAEYARAMIGNSAVRVICGYHEQAPASIDKSIAEKFLEYARSGESAKSSWILANQYYANQGYSTDVYCVLTHNGNVQYSRFEGFPGSTYTRPDSSSTTILRFSSANPNGTVQTYSVPEIFNGLIFQDGISALKSINVPTYSIVAKSINPVISEDTKAMVYRDRNNVSTISGEVGDEKVTFNADEALIKSIHWFDNNFKGLDSEQFINKPTDISTIVMAEVNLSGGKENEVVVAYNVTYNNTFNGIPILGSYYNTLVDNNGVKFSSIDWAEFSQSTLNICKDPIKFEEAAAIVSKYIKGSDFDNTISAGVVDDVELVYDFDYNTNTYQPTWLFTLDDSTKYKVNCFSGLIFKS